MALSPTSSRSSGSSGGGSTDGWTDASGTPFTFATATTFTTATDTTAIFTPGTRIKLTNSTVKYFVVVSSTFSSTTTVTVTGGTDYTLANAAITAPFYSYQVSPQGYPTWFNYTPTLVGGTSPVANCQFSVLGRQVTVNLQVQVTSTTTAYTATLPIPQPASGLACEVMIRARDNTVNLTTPGLLDLAAGAQTLVNLYKDTGFGAWTASGTKTAVGQFFYDI